MQLLVVRHAIAAPGSPDAARALTEEGRERMARGAAALRELVPGLAWIASSPLLRAVETAEILARAWGGLEIRETRHLAPGVDPARLVDWLASEVGGEAEALAVIGHEPDLSTLVTWLATGLDDSRVALGKGGAALLEFPGPVGRGRGTLLWLLRPGQLRSLAPRS